MSNPRYNRAGLLAAAEWVRDWRDQSSLASDGSREWSGGLARRGSFVYGGASSKSSAGEPFDVTKAFIAGALQESAELSGGAAARAAGDLLAAIVKELKKEGRFTLPGFGTFTVRKTKARTAFNPRTREKVKVKAGKTVRFKASPTLKRAV